MLQGSYSFITAIILLVFFFILGKFNELSVSNGAVLFPMPLLYSKSLSVHDSITDLCLSMGSVLSFC